MQILIFIVILVVLASAAYGCISSAPWVPTKGKDVERMIGLAEIKSEDIVYDLGCGDGRLVFASARRGAKSIGFEIFIIPYLVAKIRSWFNKNSKIYFTDFFRRNISDANVVFIFLTYKPYKRLIEKLDKELKSGAKIVVYCFEIKEWQDRLIKVSKTEKDLPVYVYVV